MINNSEKELFTALGHIISANKISTALLQRKLGISFISASEIIDKLIEQGFITYNADNNIRIINVSFEDYNELIKGMGIPALNSYDLKVKNNVSVDNIISKIEQSTKRAYGRGDLEKTAYEGLRLMIVEDEVGVAILQRNLGLNFEEASNVLDILVEKNLVRVAYRDGCFVREVCVTIDEFNDVVLGTGVPKILTNNFIEKRREAIYASKTKTGTKSLASMEELMYQAIELFYNSRVSVSILQKALDVTYFEAGIIVQMLVEKGLVVQDNSLVSSLKLNVTKEQYEALMAYRHH